MVVLRSQGIRLATEILGLRLANPLLVASGPLSDSLVQIRRALSAGAGGVVTKTIYFGGQNEKVTERVRKCPAGLFNSTTYSHHSLDQWLRMISTLAEEQAPIITSIYADRPEQLGDLARRVVEAGSRALELGISCPNVDLKEEPGWERVGRYTSRVRKAVDVPFSVKLTAAEGLLGQVKVALGEGADAITLSDALPSLFIDVKSRKLPFGGPVGYSGPAIKPIVLHALYQLRQAGVTCPIFGVGGIGSVSDVLEYLQIGADAVQIYTTLVTSGTNLLILILEDLFSWCEREGVTARELVGTALPGEMA
jgi:dihydroorotate dehydrogenase subfamily 1